MPAWFESLDPDEREQALARLRTSAGIPARNYAGEGASNTPFAAWLAAADQLCRADHGCSLFDLPGQRWRDYHDDHLSPADALTLALGI